MTPNLSPEMLLTLATLLKKRKVFNNLIMDCDRKIRASRRKVLLYSVLFRQRRMKRRRNIWQLVRHSKFWEEEVPLFDDSKFKECFRVSRAVFDDLVVHLAGLKRLNTKMRPSISIKKRVAIALYALGSSAEYRTVATVFGVGRSTVGEIVREVCRRICEKLEKQYINGYPPTQDKFDTILGGFASLGFPQCYGAIDGCHIEVKAPKADATDYYNYKGWHSVILLAVADHNCSFTYINVGSPGRNNDSYVYENSILKRLHRCSPIIQSNYRNIGGESVPVLLIGDSAFRLSPFLMKPFAVASSATERNFNYRLSKCRRVVENAFGRLKARFRKIGRGLEVNIKNAPCVIKACCILHNICTQNNDTIYNHWSEESAMAQREQPTFTTNITESPSVASKIRNALAQHLCCGADVGDGVEVDPNDVGVEEVDGEGEGDRIFVDVSGVDSPTVS